MRQGSIVRKKVKKLWCVCVCVSSWLYLELCIRQWDLGDSVSHRFKKQCINYSRHAPLLADNLPRSQLYSLLISSNMPTSQHTHTHTTLRCAVSNRDVYDLWGSHELIGTEVLKYVQRRISHTSISTHCAPQGCKHEISLSNKHTHTFSISPSRKFTNMR